MPRPPRLLLSQSYYHIMTRGNNRHEVFRSIQDYQYYLYLISRYRSDHPFDLYHYCLMPNHIHFLVKTNKASDFSNFMKKLNLAYFHHYRQNYGWVGHFWQDRFKSQPVGKDEYFIQCGKYIELNPIRKNIVNNLEDYRWSSYEFYSTGKRNKLISEDFLYKDLGIDQPTRQREYAKMLANETIQSTYKNKVWGSAYQQYQESKKAKYHFRNK